MNSEELIKLLSYYQHQMDNANDSDHGSEAKEINGNFQNVQRVHSALQRRLPRRVVHGNDSFDEDPG